jgi:outer membrane protein TolC
MGKRRGEKPDRPGWAPLILLCALISGCHYGPLVLWEQRHLDVRDPAQLPHAVIPDVPLPATVSSPPSSADPTQLSLDEAIRIALANSQVVRTLAGVGAFASGKTVYDPAIANTAIDEARAAFDPIITARNAFNRLEQPQAFLDPRNPAGATIFGTRIDNHELGLGISKRTVLGGTLDLDAASSTDRFTPGPAPLNPQERSSLTLRYTQPLLKGAGIGPNLAPIIIARINTERSYFQFKDSIQELVRGVIEAYWAVVFSRTDVWARRQQEEQGEFAYARAEARRQVGKVTAGEVAQAKVSLSNFKAARIGAEASLLQREAALRNIMGLPPSEPEQLVPTTPPSPVRLEPKWDAILRLAEEQRPDLIELKLIIEADEQALIVARNQALPQLDASMLYRWNGLEGTAPNGTRLSTKPGEFTDWTLGVNFSVPIGLRRSRAGLRRSELFLARDWANLNQEMHNTLQLLAGNLRNLAQFHDLYRTYKETRAAARLNLEQQFFDYQVGRGEEVKNSYLNVLLAITDWGNAVSSEAQALAQYNTELANLERQTGTILETHGIRFAEEMFGSIGPLGRLAKPQGYPSALVPGPNSPRYPAGAEPADKLLEMEKPSLRRPVPPPPPPEEPPPPKRVPRLDVRPLPDAG